MAGLFADATSVTQIVSGTPDGETVTTFTSEVKPGWDIGGNANGGYLMAIAGRAMSEAVGRPPVTLTAHYLRPAPAGPCEVEVTTVRAGRRFVTATARLTMEGGEIIRLLGTFGEQTPGGPSLTEESPPDLPAYADCELPPPPTEGPEPAIFRRLAVRIRPGDEGFRTGQPTGHAEIRGWFAFADAEPIDSIGLLLVADAFPPPIFNTELPVAWVPTVELTVHVRGTPAPGPLRCAFRSRFIHDGLLDEDGEIWDSTGTLVCQSRQLSLLPRPPA
ncbi:MAG: thioesterase family protein [Ilumatobacteraceae bacterium]